MISSGRRRHGLPLAAALVAVLISVVAVATPAQGSWIRPPNLSGTGDAAEPVVAVSPNGWAAFAWRRLDAAGDWRVELRVRSDAGVLSNPQTISPAGDSAYSPDVTIDSSGRALVVWSQRDDETGIYAVDGRYRAPDARLTTIRRISTGVGSGSPLSGSAPQVELNPDGSAVVAWQTVFPGPTYRAVARRMTPEGYVDTGWQQLSGDGTTPQKPVALAVDANGVATIAWMRDDGVDLRIEARRRTSSGLLGPLRVVSGAGQDATTPDLAVTPAGDAVIAWVRFDTSTDLLYARRLSSASGLGPATAISTATQNVEDATAAPWGEVAVDTNGNAVFAWQQARPCCSHEVAVRGWAADGTRSSIAVAGKARSVQAQVAVDPAGQALVAFTRTDSNFDDRVSVRSRAADGTLGPTQFLSATGQDAAHPDLAIAPTGLAVVTWLRSDGTDSFCCDRVQYSAGP